MNYAFGKMFKKSTKFLSEGSPRAADYKSLHIIITSKPTGDENHVLTGLHVRMVVWCKAIFVTLPSSILFILIPLYDLRSLSIQFTYVNK